MKIRTFILPVLAISFGLMSCGDGSTQKDGKSDSTSTSASNKNEIIGAGSTFVYPLFSKIFSVFNQEKGIKVNYQSIGSGGGIKQLQNKIVDFGASDNPLSDDQMSKSPSPIIHIPDCLGAVTISYNLPDNPELKFTPDVLGDIFLGVLTKWNDSRIQSLNPGVKLPDLQISVIHRSDGSGTSFIFSDYLSKISSGWQTKVGKGQSLNWPVGLGGKGNEGVAGLVKQTPGAIGYIELAYAIQNKMPVASLKNKSGNFVAPNLASTSAAANVDIPADMRVSITNTDAAEGYPIASFSYILLFKDLSYDIKSEAEAKNVADLVSWIIQDGQQYSEALNYAKLPESVVKKSLDLLKTLTYNNKLLQ
ncbi:MAG: phosphate ABC transporter substrate-binding protein PstS [Bacteroidota bacterium]|nr:phosphate ABC transporter substrate-binding protein PstS [Bacteroidota bacterium]